MSLDQSEENKPTDFSSLEYLLRVGFPLPENWHTVAEAFGEEIDTLVGGISDTAQVVRRISLIEDANELKRQLTGFLDHCDRLRKHAHRVRPPE